MTIARPVNLQKAFADTGSKNIIPVASQIGIAAGAASFTDGFPPLTMTPIAAGGVPPAGADVNGVLNILSQHTAFLGAGGRYRFDAALSTAMGGYPVGFVLQDDAGLNEYINILAANTTNFNSTPASIGVSWIPYAGQFLASLAANGYQKQPSGLIVQQGSVITTTGGNATATFPIAFPTAVYQVVCAQYAAVNVAGTTAVAHASNTLSTATFFAASGVATVGITYIAIGK